MGDLNIQIANFAEGIPGLARQINTEGAVFANDIKDAMTELRNLNEDWKGKRYSDLIAAFNEEVPKFDRMVDLLRFQLPNALNKVAENYAAVNGDTNVGKGPTDTETLPLVENPAESGMMRFVLDGVNSHKAQIESKFQNAQNTLNKIESTYVNESSMSSFWSSSASRVYIDQFRALKGEVNNAITNFLNQLNDLMQTAANEINEAESNSSVGVQKG